ncbi:hypothetical protein Acid345_3801 [Candidatus Koribacter versatilis Ellin345]|uniref:Polysaccharide pyruvyl transferase domain-containing protein n=1 Tax=Koribacter versatilis (strain Ellin345) TaxID=204669 RepID=Q1IJZ9_KORVE|nr:polysaccharide pyruvyl transferase family protein [Candidatus Koribacter versatilis]ABF42801.1 hypothetical protein Acid345_3801 [Candidatus Koribacter versatilis Ellin345]
MNITLVSTLNFNPGDEFIRLGMEHVLRQKFPDARLRPIHKHDPRTLFSGFSQKRSTPHRLLSPMLYRLYAGGPGRKQENYLESADIVVFAGTPFIWRNSPVLFRSTCANAEWVSPIWERLFDELRQVPVLNLAAGTSVSNQEQIDAITNDSTVSGFLKRALSRAQVTTVRDQISRDILGHLGFPVKTIPCSSILSAKGAFLEPQEPEYVAINLMRSASHSGRGHRGRPDEWRKSIERVVPEIEKRHRILFVSHSVDEDQTAAEWFPQHPRIVSKDPIVLLKAYSKALYGLCNRVHGAAAVATFGRPAIVVGGDSRINLIEQFGLPAYDHRQIDGPKLIERVEHIERNYDDYVRRLAAKIDDTQKAYLAALEQVLVQERQMAIGQ